MKVKKL